LEQPLKIVNGPKDPNRKPTANSAENLFALLYAQGIRARIAGQSGGDFSCFPIERTPSARTATVFRDDQ